MQTKKVDKSTSVVGLVSNFFKGEGPTGYQISFLYCRKEHLYPCTQAVYDYIDQGRIGVYPNVMELVFAPIFSPDGVVVQLLQADEFENEENCLIDTNFTIATAMRTRPRTAQTPVVGELFSIEGNILKFASDYDSRKDEVCYLFYEGAMVEPGSDVIHEMAEGFDIYTWDWATKTPISDTSPAGTIYVPGFQLGTLEDVHNSFWVWFGSLRGDDSKLDAICAFINQSISE